MKQIKKIHTICYKLLAKMLKLSTKMLKLFPMRHQLSHRRHPLHPSSIRDVRSLLRIRFLKSLNDLHVLSFLSSLLHKMGPKYRRECLPNETVLNLGKRKSEFLKLQQFLKLDDRTLRPVVYASNGNYLGIADFR